MTPPPIQPQSPPDAVPVTEPRTKTTLILAAMTLERDPLVKALRLKPYPMPTAASPDAGLPIPPIPRLFATTHADHQWIVAVTGIGTERARQTADWLISTLQPERVLIVGVAGGLDPSFKIGDILIPSSVIDVECGEMFEPTTPSSDPHVLVTTASPRLTLGEKQELNKQTSAHAVDMETAAIARVCRSRGIDWFCVRSISDTSEQALPPWIMGLTRRCGKTDLPASIARVITHPWQLPLLLRLGRQTKAATEALVRAVRERL